MFINIKKLHPDAKIPVYSTQGAAGMDVTAVSKTVTDDYIEYGTGLAFEVPEGYVMLIFPRSSVSKYDLILANSVGILDSDYRGELKLRFNRNYRIVSDNYEGTCDNVSTTTSNTYALAEKQYEIGERVGQIMILPYPMVCFEEVDELSETNRGVGGFGSTNI